MNWYTTRYRTDKELSAMVGVYFQISRQYRTIARIPPGLTVQEAWLAKAKNAKVRRKWIKEWKEEATQIRRNLSSYLIHHSVQDPTLHLILSEADFERWRVLGGGPY